MPRPDSEMDLEVIWEKLVKRTGVQIRAARAVEAGQLTELALRSKAHWGYDEAFMAACREELTITPLRLKEEFFVVADHQGVAVGCAGLSQGGDSGEVEDVFVDPAWIGQGLGGRLMGALFQGAIARGIGTLYVDADPNAQGFYEGQGFQLIGRSPSGSIPGRSLPRLVRQMEYNLL